LSWSDLTGASLNWADLSGAVLYGGGPERGRSARRDPAGADLRRANLGAASLDDAILEGAILYEADLPAASLTLIGAEETKPAAGPVPFANDDVPGAPQEGFARPAVSGDGN